MICGVGCDIVEIQRFIKNQEQIANRILSEQELIQYFNIPEKRRLEYLAGRFAAKEAIFKSLPKEYPFNTLVIEEKNKKLFCKVEAYFIYLSISHEKEYAIAYATCIEVL